MTFSFTSTAAAAALGYDSDSSDDESSAPITATPTVPARRKQRSARKQVLFASTGGNGQHQEKPTRKVFLANSNGRPMTRKTKPTSSRLLKRRQDFDDDFFKTATVVPPKVQPASTDRVRGWFSKDGMDFTREQRLRELFQTLNGSEAFRALILGIKDRSAVRSDRPRLVMERSTRERSALREAFDQAPLTANSEDIVGQLWLHMRSQAPTTTEFSWAMKVYDRWSDEQVAADNISDFIDATFGPASDGPMKSWADMCDSDDESDDDDNAWTCSRGIAVGGEYCC